MQKKIGLFWGFLVCIFMYKDNDRGGSVGGVMLSGYQDTPPKRCFNIVNVPEGFDIGRYDDSVPYYRL